MKVYIKHWMSCLPDQPIEFDIDHERREVRLTMTTFDSALVAQAATRILPEHGAMVCRDDADKSEAWLTRPAAYRMRVELAGVAYASQVVKLIDGGIAVTLEPLRSDG